MALLPCFYTTLQAQVPARPAEERLVYDFSGIFSAGEILQLETELAAFDNATSNQVCVVAVADLQGEDINMEANRILSQWGVGSAKNNNGVVILLEHQPGTAGGRVAISVGYGLEGVLTDALSKRIITQEMIPEFKEGNYFEGIWAGVAAVMAAAEEEYEIAEDDGVEIPAIAIVFMAIVITLLFFALIIVIANNRKGPTHLGGSNSKGPSMLELMILANLLGGKNRNSGSAQVLRVEGSAPEEVSVEEALAGAALADLAEALAGAGVLPEAGKWLKAATIFFTRGWRIISFESKRTKAIPLIFCSKSIHLARPLSLFLTRSIWLVSPVIINLASFPIRVKNIFN